MAQTNQATTPAPCLFLSLPAELRNTIYHLALVDEDPISVDPNSLPTRLALTETCRQIRAEASQIFFAGNTFRAEGTASDLVRAVTWLSNLEDHGLLISELILAPKSDGPVDPSSAISAIRSDGAPGQPRLERAFQELCNAAWTDAVKVNQAFQQVVEQSKLRSAAIEVVDGGGEAEWCDRVQSAIFRVRFTRWRES